MFGALFENGFEEEFWVAVISAYVRYADLEAAPTRSTHRSFYFGFGGTQEMYISTTPLIFCNHPNYETGIQYL